MIVTTEARRRSDGGTIQVDEPVLDALKEHDGIDVNSEEWTLYEYIEPDALNALFSHKRNRGISVEFMVKGIMVTVW